MIISASDSMPLAVSDSDSMIMMSDRRTLAARAAAAKRARTRD